MPLRKNRPNCDGNSHPELDLKVEKILSTNFGTQIQSTHLSLQLVKFQEVLKSLVKQGIMSSHEPFDDF